VNVHFPNKSLETEAAVALPERRSAPRHRVLQRCFVRPVSGEGGESWKGIVYDVSATGVGVALPYPLAIGTLLTIESSGLPAAQVLQARVVRISPVSYLWFCGCALEVHMRDAELQAWLSARIDGQIV
jgi:hypothetical protein